MDRNWVFATRKKKSMRGKYMLNAKSNKALFFMFSCQILMIFHSVDIIKNDQNLVAKTEKKNLDLLEYIQFHY